MPVKPTVAPKATPARPSKSQAIIAQKNSPILQERPIGPKESSPQREMRREEPPPRNPAEDKFAIAERPLPTLKELLPPANWSASGQRSNRNDGPVHLNTRDPQFVTYFGSIKRAIEVVWQYPEMALRYGLQGKLLMEFSIMGNGELARARIVRSSGSNLLDEEALRAVRLAAPFNPIPPWIGKENIDILASFEYYDNRLNYRYMP
jgi:protein TonB